MNEPLLSNFESSSYPTQHKSGLFYAPLWSNWSYKNLDNWSFVLNAFSSEIYLCKRNDICSKIVCLEKLQPKQLRFNFKYNNW